MDATRPPAARKDARVRTDDFDYDLPSGLIAQHPVEPRDSCRLMVVDRGSGQIDRRVFSDVGDYLRAGDLLVVNDTRVIAARLKGAKLDTGGLAEVLLLREKYTDTWECLVKPGRRLKPGAHVVFGDGALTGLIVGAPDESGTRLVQFHTSGEKFMDVVRRLGEIPLPPYVTEPIKDPESYQTVFATSERSAAAPTGGLHFTNELLQSLKSSGVEVARVELDIGLDTFRPISEDDPRDHRIHSERYRVAPWTAEAVNGAHERGGRIFAVGTTSVRALESAWDEETQSVLPAEGDTDLFIMPGHRFRTVDALITNFHMPRSTLMLLVSAFAGRELVMSAYRQAMDEHYRFLSFGDAMLFL
jgi:S-adenosylmethionine:tRNA ribosyltransferase-isomerase